MDVRTSRDLSDLLRKSGVRGDAAATGMPLSLREQPVVITQDATNVVVPMKHRRYVFGTPVPAQVGKWIAYLIRPTTGPIRMDRVWCGSTDDGWFGPFDWNLVSALFTQIGVPYNGNSVGDGTLGAASLANSQTAFTCDGNFPADLFPLAIVTGAQRISANQHADLDWVLWPGQVFILAQKTVNTPFEATMTFLEFGGPPSVS